MHDVSELISQLELIPHPEGGYFREVFRSGAVPMTSRGLTDPKGDTFVPREGEAPRNVLTSIYWLPTAEHPIGWLCCNRSDHVHYYHLGAALTYHIVAPDGSLKVQRLGPDVAAGDVLQLVVPGGHWKAAHLEQGDFCLLGEAVAPGFDFNDFRFVAEEELVGQFPQHAALSRFIKPDQRRDFARYYNSEATPPK